MNEQDRIREFFEDLEAGRAIRVAPPKGADSWIAFGEAQGRRKAIDNAMAAVVALAPGPYIGSGPLVSLRDVLAVLRETR